MAIIDIYSKRKAARERNGQPEVYSYDEITVKLRTQILYILRDILGNPEGAYGNAQEHWSVLEGLLCPELGLESLSYAHTPYERCKLFLAECRDTDHVLDLTELGVRVSRWIQEKIDARSYVHYGIKSTTAQGVVDINTRFRENAVGYVIEGDTLLRFDNLHVHSEIVRPALQLLIDPVYSKANKDFHEAFEEYRHGRSKSAITACGRSLESLLKAICDQRAWVYQPGDRFSELLTVVRVKGLFPEYLGRSFDSYVAMLKSGVPHIRNNAGAHGEGVQSEPVPDYLPSYVLHMTATNIVMLATAAATSPNNV